MGTVGVPDSAAGRLPRPAPHPEPPPGPTQADPARDARPWWLGLPALALGGAGEWMLFQVQLRFLGVLVLGGAAALGVAAWGRLPLPPVFGPGPAEAGLRPGPRGPARWRRAGVAGAVLLAASSMVAWWADPGAVFGLQGLLWLASCALLVAACARWYPAGPAPAGDLTWTRWEIALAGAILALSLVTHLALLDEIPWRFQLDEIGVHGEALRFFRGPAISLFTTTWTTTGMPSLFFGVAGALMHIFGTALGGVRSSVALIGALTVLPVYGLARLVVGRAAAPIAAFSAATCAVAVHFSRISIPNMTTAFCWAVCFYYLLKGLRSGGAADFAWAGLAAGWSMYSYYATRLLPYLLAAYVLYLVLFHRRATKERRGLLLLLPVGFFVGFGPLLAYFTRHPDVWAGRGLNELVVPAALPLSWGLLLADVQVLAPRLWVNFLALSVIPSHDSDYFGALLLPADAVLALLGFGLLLWRWRRPGAFLLTLWAASIVFVGGILIDIGHDPALNHWTPAFPAVSLFVAVPPAMLLAALPAQARRRRAAAALIVAAVLAGGAANLYYYWVLYPPTVPPAFESARSRFLATVSLHSRVRFVGDSAQAFDPDAAQMLAPQVTASDFLNPSRELPVLGDAGHDLLFVFNDDEVQYLPLVAGYYPGGQIGRIATPGGAIGQTYSVPAAQALRGYGVTLTLQAPGRPAWSGPVARVGAVPPNVAAGAPLTATWSGAVYTAGATPLRLDVAGAPAAVLRVQGERVARGSAVPVDAGWVPFSVEAALGAGLPAAGAVRLLEQPGPGPPTEVDALHLWPQAPDAGLAVRMNGRVLTRRIDPFVGAGVLYPDQNTWQGLVPPPVARDPEFAALAPLGGGGDHLTWEGEVRADGGSYTLELRTDAHARLALDGAPVIDLCRNPGVSMVDFFQGHYRAATQRVLLTPGWHQVRLDLVATGEMNGLEWTWTRPDGTREIVPPARLRHRADPGAGPSGPLGPGCPAGP